MKKVISFIAIALIVICGAVGIYVYQLIRAPLVEGTEKAAAYVLESDILQGVDDVQFYHGTDAYWVVRGSDDQDRDMYVWVRQKDEKLKKTEVLPVKEGISEEGAKRVVTNKIGAKQIDTIRLGYEEEQPVYELTYTDKNGGKTFAYVSFTNGDLLKSYSLEKGGNE